MSLVNWRPPNCQTHLLVVWIIIHWLRAAKCKYVKTKTQWAIKLKALDGFPSHCKWSRKTETHILLKKVSEIVFMKLSLWWAPNGYAHSSYLRRYDIAYLLLNISHSKHFPNSKNKGNHHMSWWASWFLFVNKNEKRAPRLQLQARDPQHYYADDATAW